MMMAESVARLASTLLAVVQTRVDLVATEVEEESLRYFSYLVRALAALFCVGIAVVLAVFLAVLLAWDNYRVGVLLALIILFGGIGLWIGMQVRHQYRQKPKLLGHTMQELAHDTELLRPPAS
jgi:uncharacterized membrane protein YqjE